MLHVASEVAPFVKTGGLGDVAAALPVALRREGVDARLILPGYAAILDALEDAEVIGEDPNLFEGGHARLLAGRLGDVPTYAVDAPALFARAGGPYSDVEGNDWPDNHRRFASLGWAAAAIVNAFDLDAQPTVLHAHDWQGGLAPAFVRYGPRPHVPCVATIHNLAYQGVFAPETFAELGLPQQAFGVNGVEFYGSVGFLKSGLFYSDVITTVSPTYAREIQTAASGHGMEGLLSSRSNRLLGVLNGVDYSVWDPQHDESIAQTYGPEDVVSGKRAARAALRKRFGIPEQGALIGMVTRLARQKGIDFVVDAFARFPSDVRLILLGSGDPEIEHSVRDLAARQQRVFAHVGYDDGLAHAIMAGADMLLVPSREEPCGMTQLYAMRYGTPPIVHRVGGLADTVSDADASDGTGFVFDHPDHLAQAVSRAVSAHADPLRWAPIVRRAMHADFGWERSAKEYRAIYEELARR